MSHFFDDGVGSPPTVPTRSREYDALADLFLSDQPDAPALRLTETPDSASASAEPLERSPAARTPGVEALVLGHLPVLAGAWAAQHARSLAEETGHPVALARWSEHSATIQLMGRRREPGDPQEQESVDDAITRCAAADPSWSVRVEATSELDLAAAPEVTRVTLLSGADEAAVVAAYRTLKGLCEVIPEDDPRLLAVRVMGATEEDAQDAAMKIRRASAAFLNRAIEFLPPTRQISAGAGVTLYRGPADGGFESLLHAVTRAGAPTSPPTGERPPENPAREDAQPHPGLAEKLGLVGLEIRCPSAPACAFATDDAGTLHLLATGENAASDLIAAEGWVQANREVLAAATGLDAGAPVLPRLITAEPARDRRLLEGRYRVDLLREVRVGDETAWCTVPLNTES